MSGKEEESLELPEIRADHCSTLDPKADANDSDVSRQIESKRRQPTASQSVPYYRLYSYADRLDAILLVLGCIGSVIHGLALPIFFVVFGDVVDALGTENTSLIPQYTLYIVYEAIAVWIGGWLEVSCWMQSGERQASRLRELYLAAILKQEVAFFDQAASSGEIVDAVTTDVVLVQEAISEKMGQFLFFMTTFLAGLIIGIVKCWQLALVILAIVPLLAACGAAYQIALTGVTSREKEAYVTAGSIAEQAFAQVRTVYSFVGEARTVEQYMAALQSCVAVSIRGGLYKGIAMGSNYGVCFLGFGLLFYYAAVLVARGAATGGTALTTMFSVLIGGLSLGQGLSNLSSFTRGQAAAYSLFETLKRQPAISVDDPAGERLEEGTVQGEITLTDVHFAYPARPDVTIFEGFSLTIPARKTVAIVGPSGSGKSTVVALIQRFYDPLAGTVALDGKDLRSLNLRSLRGHMGLVSQEPALFATTILENILYGGKPGASVEEVEAAAQAANAHAFISQLPEGYDTQVGERGTQMSGGQKQRIAIARAILRNPEILLLDEATSALDAQSERVVQEALDGVMGGRTTVVIAHRLSTVCNADLIAVVAKGRLVEQGTHDDLMAKGDAGEYASLVKMQVLATGAAAGTDDVAGESGQGEGDGQLGGESSARLQHVAELQASSGISAKSGLSSLVPSLHDRKTGDDVADVSTSQQPHSNVWWRLLRMTFPDAPFLLLAVAGAAASGAFNPAFGLIITTVIVAYYNPDSSAMQAEVNKWALIISALGILSVFTYTLQHYGFAVVGERLLSRVRRMMMTAFLRNEVAWFDHASISGGSLAGRLSTSAALVRAAVTDRSSVAVQNVSLVAVAFGVAFALQWRMALATLATFPLLVLSTTCEQAFYQGFSGDLVAAHEEASHLASEAISNIRTVAALSLDSKLLLLFKARLAAPLRRAVVRGQIAGFGFGFTSFLLYACFAFSFWFQSVIVPTYATFSDTFKVFLIIVMTSFAISETLALAPDFAKGSHALRSFFATVDREPEILPDDPTAEIVPTDAASIKGEIELLHVRFAYPTRPDVILFDDFNLHVPAGRSLALVGRSGSGKSSVVSLIERFYDPLAGRVCVDGRDIRSFNLRSLRLHIGLVSQEPALFNMTIRENILYGRESATEAEIIEAAKAANAHNYISSLPDAYETNVGERGNHLSGGQKQRIAIARAVLKNPAILLLDEATSALDAESERVVQEALDRLMVGRTSVVVAHRLSTIQHADSIAVVQDGKILERGTHEELLGNPSSAYHTLVKMQQGARGH